MLLASLGDLILDVVVQLDAPLLPGRRPPRDDPGRRRRAGRERRRMGACVSAPRRATSASAAPTRPGALAAARARCPRRRARRARRRARRRGRLDRLGGRPVDGLRPGLGDRARAGRARRRSGSHATRFISPATRCSPSRRASAAVRAVELARGQGARVSVDLSTWSLIDDAFRERVRRCAPDARLRDRARAGGLRPTRRPSGSSSAVLRGVTVDGVDHPAHPVEVVDPTGAGDAFAAGYLVGGVQLGLEAAARCCAKLGAMP